MEYSIKLRLLELEVGRPDRPPGLSDFIRPQEMGESASWILEYAEISKAAPKDFRNKLDCMLPPTLKKALIAVGAAMNKTPGWYDTKEKLDDLVDREVNKALAEQRVREKAGGKKIRPRSITVTTGTKKTTKTTKTKKTPRTKKT